MSLKYYFFLVIALIFVLTTTATPVQNRPMQVRQANSPTNTA
ncbi:31502_t:CDS:1, partial [Racocetra persica]